MKLNISKTGNSYSSVIKGCKYEYGWYKSGKAFIAKDGELMSYAEAYKEFVPKSCFGLYNRFYAGVDSYDKTINGIVHYLIDKYNK